MWILDGRVGKSASLVAAGDVRACSQRPADKEDDVRTGLD